MCPLCIASAALIAAKVTSTGGLAAFVAKKSCFNSNAKKNNQPNQFKGELK